MPIQDHIPIELRKSLRRLPRALGPADAYALPDYIIIGAQKCGTTSMDINLAKHPDVHMALFQEVHFFDYNFHKGEGWYRRHFHKTAMASAHRERTGRSLLTGESSPYYIFHPHCPARVKSVCPDVKLIALLRNPADRAYSHYHHERRYDWDDRPLEDAFDWDREREMLEREVPRMLDDPAYFSWAHRHESYLARGIYADQLERWLEHFPREQLLVVQSEAFYRDMNSEMARVFGYIGAEPLRIEDASRENANTYSSIEQGVRDELLAFYEPHNERLYELIGRRFDW